ncbi:uncharacterized protein LOC132196798 [Neocloeon triangulifer]|uniref:uncharacterized protein LOC132196798 n=1 Tax=Neocloeon triangulifer TaxID=2078957 RepID=UPI00286EF6C2|nr:uncharacterized protein LOC132196798 [Neocloeon triangulifer]
MPDSLLFAEANKAFFSRQLSQTSQLSEALSTSSERKSISQKSKKKPDQIDVALEKEGLCRKLMPRDGSTIFRAVSDQLYGTQAYQKEVKEVMLLYFYEKHEELEQIISNYQNCNTFIDYITHKMVCAVECCFRTGIHLYDESGNAIFYESASSGEERSKKVIKLAVDRQLCWDSVYPVDYFKVQGICQSLLYECLYVNVFNLKNVFFAVEMMLGKPKKNLQQASKVNPDKETMLSLLTNKFKDSDLTLDLKVLIDMGIPPFPYKVAKSLSPLVYRNTEYDVCASAKSPNTENISKNFLFEGCKCIIHKRSNYRYYGYVQRLFPELGKAVVFVEQLGELCEIAIELIEPVIAAKKATRRRKSKYGSRRYSSVSMDSHMSDDEGDVDVFEEEPVEMDEHFFKNAAKKIKSLTSVDEGYSEAEPTEEQIPAIKKAVPEELQLCAPAKDNWQDDQLTGVDSVSQYLLSVYGPQNMAVVPGYPGLVNKSALPSYEMDGSDLKIWDVSTLRFFYNLGQRHFHAAMYNLFLEQDLVCLVTLDPLTATSNYNAHLLSPVLKNGMKYPLCIYAGEMMVTGQHTQLNEELKDVSSNFSGINGDVGSAEWKDDIEKTFEDILHGNPACLNVIGWEKSGVCRTCMFYYFGKYFAHYPRSFPFPVNLCCQPSMHEDGSDLPFDDAFSIRYYYNLGIRNHQAAELSFLHQNGTISFDTLFGTFGEEQDDFNVSCAIHMKFGRQVCNMSENISCTTYNKYRSALERQFVYIVNKKIQG